MNKLFIVVFILLSGCSYIPFQSECERLPKDLSYYGITKHFGRDPDFIDYRTREMSKDTIYRYIIYYWGTCDESTTLAYIYQRRFEINEHGMSVNTNNEVFVELVQTSIGALKSE